VGFELTTLVVIGTDCTYDHDRPSNLLTLSVYQKYVVHTKIYIYVLITFYKLSYILFSKSNIILWYNICFWYLSYIFPTLDSYNCYVCYGRMGTDQGFKLCWGNLN